MCDAPKHSLNMKTAVNITGCHELNIRLPVEWSLISLIAPVSSNMTQRIATVPTLWCCNRDLQYRKQ